MGMMDRLGIKGSLYTAAAMSWMGQVVSQLPSMCWRRAINTQAATFANFAQLLCPTQSTKSGVDELSAAYNPTTTNNPRTQPHTVVTC
jgi:hypothetical protein